MHSEPDVERKASKLHFESKPLVLCSEDVAAGRMQADIDWANSYSPTNSVGARCDDATDGSEDVDLESLSDSHRATVRAYPPTTRRGGTCYAMATSR